MVSLEIILGIDNLVFIAILANKLPPHQRNKARNLGLSLALLMRLGLLFIMSWLVTLTEPVVNYGGFALSVRDLILVVGGVFLLFKATLELQEPDLLSNVEQLTIGGYINSKLKGISQVNDHISAEGYHFTVLETLSSRILLVKIEKQAGL